MAPVGVFLPLRRVRLGPSEQTRNLVSVRAQARRCFAMAQVPNPKRAGRLALCWLIMTTVMSARTSLRS